MLTRPDLPITKYHPASVSIRLALGAIVALQLCSSITRAAEQSRPNAIVIVADDLGYADLSFLEQAPSDVKNLRTSSLDRLASMGTYFTEAYSTSPICSPSRCGLITGSYQQRWGNYWYGQGGLPSGRTTLPQVLKENGYRTVKVGKTHLNGGDAEHPLDHGFEEYFGFNHHTWDYIRLSDADLKAYQERADGDGLGNTWRRAARQRTQRSGFD